MNRRGHPSEMVIDAAELSRRAHISDSELRETIAEVQLEIERGVGQLAERRRFVAYLRRLQQARISAEVAS